MNEAPHDSLGQGARRIAELFDARWIVMGHTHQPVSQQMANGATYVNLGSWGQDDPPDERVAHHAPLQSFLLIDRGPGGREAKLLRWIDGEGPVAMPPAPMPSLLEAQPEPEVAAESAGLMAGLRRKLRALRKRTAPAPLVAAADRPASYALTA